MDEAYTVIIITAEPEVLSLCRDALNGDAVVEYRILQASDCDDGLSLIASEHPHCVLLDAAYPHDAGWQALKNLHASHPDLPVIMLIDAADETVATRVLQEGAQDYIVKAEISGDLLRKLIQLAVAARQARREKNDADNKIIRLLIIDDNPDDREFFQRSLKKVKSAQYHVSEAANGEVGLELIDRVHPHCVLLDYSMPGRNGLEILKYIRVRYPYIPVIVLTGQGNETIAVQVMKEGAQDYIRKSEINAESLHRMIKISVEYCALQKRVMEQQDSLMLFTRALAHDLKEPVRMIISFADLINKDYKLSGKKRAYFDVISAAALNMERLIDMVRVYTQLNSGNYSVEKEVVDCKDILNMVLLNLKKQITECDAHIKCNVSGEVYCNKIHLLQVFQNIISNALSYRGQDKPSIYVSAQFRPEYTLFAVSDNGCGISLSYGEQIFEPFKRFSSEHRGSGLGLAICKSILGYYGGNIWYESVVGKGTTFKFTLPRGGVTVPIITSNENFVSMRQQITEASERTLANVLLVEDSDPDIELARIILFEEDNLQFNLFTAANGEEALSFLQNKNNPAPDLIFLDINMPVMGGFDFLKCIRNEKFFSTLPVIICSTSSYEKDIARAKELGAVGYINKPLSLKKIQPQLQAVKSIFLAESKSGVELRRVMH